MSAALGWVILGVVVALIGVVVAGFVEVVALVRSEVGRLDAKIDTKVDGLARDLRSEMGGLRSEIGGLRSEVGRLDAKIDTKVDGLARDLRSEMATQFGRLEAQMAAQTARVDAQTARIDHLAERVEEHLRSHAEASAHS